MNDTLTLPPHSPYLLGSTAISHHPLSRLLMNKRLIPISATRRLVSRSNITVTKSSLLTLIIHFNITSRRSYDHVTPVACHQCRSVADGRPCHCRNRCRLSC